MVSLLLPQAVLDVGSHCVFFDRLADLVDPRFYSADEEREHINPKYMKRVERAAIKRVFKEQHKQNKRARLDPDAIQTTTQLQRAQAEAAEQQQQQQHAGGRGQAAVQQMGVLHLSAGGASSREDLLKRLHAKVEAARQARTAKDDAGGGNAKQQQKQQAKQLQKQQAKQQKQALQSPAADAKQWRNEQLGKKLKTQQQQQQQQQQQAGQKRKLEQPDQQQPKGQQQQQQQQQGDGGSLAFSKLVADPGPGAGGGRRAKKAKPSKQEALKAAEHKQQRLADAEARQDKEAVAAEAWRAALSRAAGERVLDDPKLLRRSIKREAAAKAASARRWQERAAAQQDAQRARQDRRKDNLAARSATKLENKKAKREKKLLRAGFEGRKAGFINTGGGGGKQK